MAKVRDDEIEDLSVQFIDPQMVPSIVKSMKMDDRSIVQIFFNRAFQVQSLEQQVADVETDGKPEILYEFVDPFKRISERLDRYSGRIDAALQDLFRTLSEAALPSL